MILGAHQPNYLPWLGFFDKMLQSDVFVISDNLQFERHDFQNRNQIKTPQGTKWLTVSVKHDGNGNLMPINEIKIANHNNLPGLKRHWETLKANYVRAPYWKEYKDFFESAYQQEWTMQVDLNMHLIEGLRKFLNINTPLIKSSSLSATGQNSELIIAQCKELGADMYLSGVGAKSYLNFERFREEGIEVRFQDFQHPVYNQLHGEFVPNLSAVDYLLCTGGKMWRTRALRSKTPCKACQAGDT